MGSKLNQKQKAELGFVIHLAVYVTVVGSLMALNFSRHPEKIWSLWVAGGWGLGVATHGVLLVQKLNSGRGLPRKERHSHSKSESNMQFHAQAR